MECRWLPRLQNEEADALTNSDYTAFDLNRRIHVELDQLGFVYLDRLLAEGDEFIAELEERKAAMKAERSRAKAAGARHRPEDEASSAGKRRRKRAKEEPLRTRDPW